MKKLLTAAAALTLIATVGHSSVARADEPLDTCTVVIDMEYNGDDERWGDCIGSVEGWLQSIGAPSEATDAQVVEAVVELTELFRPEFCPGEETELPEAIETAAAAIVDDEVRQEILLIAEQIRTCEFVATAAINEPFIPDGSPSSVSPS